LGVMLYEMAYGVVPFFAETLEETLKKIVNHQRTLLLHDDIELSSGLRGLIKRLLVEAALRLGRKGLHEVQGHAYFKGISWRHLHELPRPSGLLVPRFTEASNANIPSPEEEISDPVSYFPEGSFTTIHPEYTLRPRSGSTDSKMVSPFYGFTWGPPKDAFSNVLHPSSVPSINPTPRVLRRTTATLSSSRGRMTDASYMTPLRPGFTPGTSTVRRTRPMSDRQALQQLMSAVRQSAHKKVLESGKKRLNFASRREKAIVPMGQSTGANLEDDADVTGRTDAPPSPSPRPGSSMGRIRPPSRSTLTEEWPSLLHDRERPIKWEDMEQRKLKLIEGVMEAERRLRELKLLVR